MNTIVTIDKAGRVVIPIRMRNEMNLTAGDELALESSGESVTLRPVRSVPRMRKKKGMWVFNSGGPPLSLETTNKVLRDLRDERDRRNRGEVDS
jgi:AbrB family looped-hinge helix DNA binding protein